MCGILGLVGSAQQHQHGLSADEGALIRMRDTMTHRGPDDAGLVINRHVAFAHRRLSVIDRAGGAQPMWSPDKRFLITYNGELYNDADLRAELTREAGIQFRTRCDTETVLMAFAHWGMQALSKFRGMYAFGIYDFKLNLLTLARDPLGLKPLYYGQVNDEVIFASSIPALLSHPNASPVPNLPVMSAYLTTIRTTLGPETMFNGIFTVRPGEVLQVRWPDPDPNAAAETSGPEFTSRFHWTEPAPIDDGELSFDDAVELVREAVIDSVQRHLRSDVPRCMLLSGGLDSAIIAAVCRVVGANDALQSWCASDPSDDGGDREHAQLMADRVQALHHEVLVDEAAFNMCWDHIILREGLPLSTPNETAIFGLARDLKRQATVALSGEGADELFAGYAGPMLCGLDGYHAGADPGTWPGDAAAHARYRDELTEQYGLSELGSPIEHYLRCNSWIAPQYKPGILQPKVYESLENDTRLMQELQSQFSADPETLDPSARLLNVHRRLNLTGLVQRLDSSSMLAGVEGRTPFADVRIAELAMRLPMRHKMQVTDADDGGWNSAAMVMQAQRVETKRVLRKAFAKELPPVICNRPKASFPLPFQAWLTQGSIALRDSALIRELVHPDVLKVITTNPGGNWQVAWPLINLAKWSKRWWC